MDERQLISIVTLMLILKLTNLILVPGLRLKEITMPGRISNLGARKIARRGIHLEGTYRRREQFLIGLMVRRARGTGALLGTGTITGTIIGMEAGGSETGDIEFCGHSCCYELGKGSLPR